MTRLRQSARRERSYLGAEGIKDFLRDHVGMTDLTTKAVSHLADRNRLPIAKFVAYRSIISRTFVYFCK